MAHLSQRCMGSSELSRAENSAAVAGWLRQAVVCGRLELSRLFSFWEVSCELLAYWYENRFP
jgi:hypothetical protein